MLFHLKNHYKMYKNYNILLLQMYNRVLCHQR